MDDFLRLHTHVDVNVVDKTGWTAGLFAVERNDVALGKQAPCYMHYIHCIIHVYLMALITCVALYSITVSVLVAAGADTAFKNPKGVNMLTLARDKNFNDIVKVLTNFPDATSMKVMHIIAPTPLPYLHHCTCTTHSSPLYLYIGCFVGSEVCESVWRCHC